MKLEEKIVKLHSLLQDIMRRKPELANNSFSFVTKSGEVLEISVPSTVKYAYIANIPFKDLPLEDWNYNISWRYDDDGFTNAAFALPFAVVDDVSDYFVKLVSA